MIPWNNLYSERSRLTHSNLVSGSSDFSIQLAAGYPDPSLFPLQELHAVTAAFSDMNDTSVLQYNSPGGFEPLREVISEKSRKTSLSNILVTHGSQQGLDLLAKLLLNRGDTVIVEAPTFHGALWVFESAEAKVVSIPVDSQGMDVDALENYLRSHSGVNQPKLIYTIPTFHNPTGATMPLERRLELIRISETYSIPIVEDAPYNELWFDSEPPPTLLDLGDTGQVLHLGTFSKTLCPSFRVGWLTAPEEVISKCLHFKHIADTCSNGFIQQVVHRLHLNGHLQNNIQRAQKLYRSKRDALTDAVKRIRSDDLGYHEPQGGFFAWLELGTFISGELLQEEARKRGVLIAASPMFYLGREGASSACRITFSYPTESEISKGIHILGEIIKNHKVRDGVVWKT
ncbi:aminotransferase-like domain-containing protein [Paenibacillus brasilensis]|uniref:2-aminoadipate transaminase n=1 Tax=Paenibacillus brasilensis TaxID=128574 RepID=A0ABU0KTR2_9BACL|nr:PLP-dependent aminotransferase family protein [Paenibacillus brasilensis]MDQ0492827.1 2-aminoadipate transaminase [Paenibacillus brasilensis]